MEDTSDPLLIEAWTDPATGIYVQHKRYTAESAKLLPHDTYWHAYPDADELHAPAGAHGYSAEQAIAKLLAKRPDLRKAA